LSCENAAPRPQLIVSQAPMSLNFATPLSSKPSKATARAGRSFSSPSR
jgi:hypothetical protein